MTTPPEPGPARLRHHIRVFTTTCKRQLRRMKNDPGEFIGKCLLYSTLFIPVRTISLLYETFRYAYQSARTLHERQRHSIQEKRLERRLRTRCQHSNRPVHSQSSSTLLSRLPLELRQQIYEECYYGLSTHITIQRKGYLAKAHGEAVRVLPDPDGHGALLADSFSVRHGFVTYNFKDGDGAFSVRRPLSLPLACRQTFQETIGYLYTHNMMHVTSFDQLRDMQRVLRPQDFHKIRSLCISCEGRAVRSRCIVGTTRYDWHHLPALLEIIAALPKLEVLHIRLMDLGHINYMPALPNLTHLKRFHVEFQFWRYSPEQVQDVPFRLRCAGRITPGDPVRCNAQCQKSRSGRHLWCDVVTNAQTSSQPPIQPL